VLFIEYDVTEQGEIELVALVNAVEQDGEDPDGEAWLRWRATHEDEGAGCVGVSQADLLALEASVGPKEVRNIVERIILEDRATKETAIS
jgi:hypothetical protein